MSALLPFLLPFQITCGLLPSGEPRWFSASGAFICAQSSAFEAQIRLRLPPTRGQFRAVDCDRDLTEDGNPDDFNTLTISEGFLWWRRTRIIPSETPSFRFARTEKTNSCPAAVVLTGETAGTQQAILDFVVRGSSSPKPLEIEYGCRDRTYSTLIGSPWSSGLGVGSCVALAGSRSMLNVALSVPRGTIRIVGLTCGIQATVVIDPAKIEFRNRKAWYPFPIVISEGICPMIVHTALEGADPQRADFLFVGQQRGRAELDSPSWTFDGSRGRILAPLGATAFEVQLLQADKVIWRSAANDKSVKLPDSVQPGNRACATAWGRENSVSTMCFEAISGKEIAYDFR